MRTFRGIIANLKKLKLKHCEKLRTQLIANLEKRLAHVESTEIYVFASLLTPKYNKCWLKASEGEKWDQQLIDNIKDYIEKFPIADNESVENSSLDTSINEPPNKRIKLFDYMKNSKHSTSSNKSKKSIELCVQEYFNICNQISYEELTDTRAFWCKYQHLWPELAAYAKMILTIPATSAPVERIFSVGGAILRPSRRKII